MWNGVPAIVIGNNAGYSNGASGCDIHTINGGPGQLAGSAIAGAGLACKPTIRGCPGGFVPTATPAFLHAATA